MNCILLSAVAVILYLASTVLLSLRLSRGVAGLAMDKSRILSIGLGGVLVHAAILYQGLFTDAGLNLGFFNASSLVTWLIVLLLLVSAYRKPIENLGIILLPIAALSIVLENLYPSEHLIQSSATWALDIHILISIAAYSLLSIAAVQAVLLAVQDRHLHNKHPGGFIRALPPLQTMENLLFQMIAVGFVLLSLALISGFIFLEDMFAQHLGHKTILSTIAWGVFATLLWGRHRFGWRGRVAIRWTLSGFLVLMLAYFGSKLVLELILQR